jgi:hypothetical protein
VGGLGLGVALTTFGFGVRHGIDWDHLAAITDITSSQRSPRRSMLLATLYACGHGLVVLGLGIAAIVFADHLPTSVDASMGRIVGATLIGLGLFVLYSLVRHGSEFRIRSRWTLALLAGRRLRRWVRGHRATTVVIEHDHEHGAAEPHPDGLHAHPVGTSGPGASHAEPLRHSHPHRHVASLPDDPFDAYGGRMAFSIGMIHGIGAETPTQVLLFVTAAGASGASAGVALLVCFLVGLLTSNTLVALAATFGFNASSSFKSYAVLSVLIALSSLIIGGELLLGRHLPSILGS